MQKLTQIKKLVLRVLEERGGTIIHARGYGAFVHVVQCLGWDQQDNDIIHKVAEACRQLERDGLVEIDWAPNSSMDRPRCSAVSLVATAAVVAHRAEGLEELTEEEVRRQLARCAHLIDYLEGQHDEDKRDLRAQEERISELTATVAMLRGEVSLLEEEVTESRDTISTLRAELRRAQGAMSKAPKADDGALQERINRLEGQLRSAQRRASRAEEERDRAKDELEDAWAELRTIKPCHDALHREMGVASGKHLKLGWISRHLVGEPQDCR